jgi:hypothetical protein
VRKRTNFEGTFGELHCSAPALCRALLASSETEPNNEAPLFACGGASSSWEHRAVRKVQITRPTSSRAVGLAILRQQEHRRLAYGGASLFWHGGTRFLSTCFLKRTTLRRVIVGPAPSTNNRRKVEKIAGSKGLVYGRNSSLGFQGYIHPYVFC